MKRIIIFALILFAFGLNVNAQTDEHLCSHAKSSATRNTQFYPGDSNIDVTYYKLNISLNFIAETISGSTLINAKSMIDDLTQFNLDFQDNMQISFVLLGGNSLNFTRNNNLIYITLDRAYNTGEEFSVIIMYQGNPQVSGFGSFVFTEHNGTPLVWSLSEPYGASAWFPCKDTPADKADSSDVWITCRDDFTAVSNGLLEEVVQNNDNTKTFKWKNSYPIAQYLISVAATNYVQYDTDYHYGVESVLPINNYVFPEYLEDLKQHMDRTPIMMGVFSELFGPYPFLNEKYGHAQCTFSGGMEHQTITSIRSGSYWSEALVSHELAHQWFGDKITCKDWENIWLNEGFATYSESLYFEEMYGHDIFISDVQLNMQSAKNAQGTLYVEDISNWQNIFNGDRSYAKGSIVLHMLRGVVGDENFFQILQNYLEDPLLAYGVAVTEDFQRHAEDVYGQDLDYFFDEWVYGENFPTYIVAWGSNFDGVNSTVNVTLQQAVNDNPSFFTMPVEIGLTTTAFDTVITVFNNQQSQQFFLTVEGEVTNLVLDPNEWLLDGTDYVLDVEDDESLPLTFELMQNYPNPFNPSTVISFQLSEPGFVNLKVFDLLGNEVAELINDEMEAGRHEVIFDAVSNGNNISSGVYFYNITSGDFNATKKMILIK